MKSPLRLVGVAARPERRASGGGLSWAPAVILLGIAGLSTWLGADGARAPTRASALAEQAVASSLERGIDAPEVREAMIAVRRIVGSRPLDTASRVAYAGLLLASSRRVEETTAAAFHAKQAARLSPVTVPVVRAAALVLTRARESDAALELVRSMFEFDPYAAARLLARMEPLLETGVEPGLADDPDAWLAWSSRLREDRRAGEADAWLDRAHRRWPEHLPLLQQQAARFTRETDWGALGQLLPDERELPDLTAAAPILLYRARLRAAGADLERARGDVARALQLDGDNRLVRILAGEAYEAIGDVSEARRQWAGALFAVDEDDPAPRRLLLLRLARLEDRHGRPADALQLWRALIELDPHHLEARRRVEDLTGFTR